MLRSVTFIVLVLAYIAPSFSQSVENKLFKVDFLLPGISFEHKVTSKSTVVINPLMGFGFGKLGEDEYFSLLPNINLEYRYYHNLERRTSLGKNIAGNSANYIAPRVILVFPAIVFGYEAETDFAAAVGVVYGIQRTYKNGIYILAEGGFAYAGGEVLISPLLTFKFGYVFKNKP